MSKTILIVLLAHAALVVFIVYNFYFSHDARSVRELGKLNKITEDLSTEIEIEDVERMAELYRNLKKFRYGARYHADKTDHFLAIISLTLKRIQVKKMDDKITKIQKTLEDNKNNKPSKK